MRSHNSLRGLTVHSLVWLALLGLALASCKSAPVKNAGQKQVAESRQHHESFPSAASTPGESVSNPAEPDTGPSAEKPAAEKPVVEKPVVEKPVVEKLSPAEKARQHLEEKFLTEAEVAFRAGRLTEPTHDNAYDRFQSVLMLNPDNSVARAGVQAILLSYTDRIRAALSDGNGGFAASLLHRAELYYPANPLLMDLKKEVARLRAREEEMMLTSGTITDDTRMEFPLPSGALSRRSPTISDYLSRIAQRLRETDESVMIYARTDAEGRWIYGQLKEAVPDYRVRGDIRIAQSPKISVLPPLQ